MTIRITPPVTPLNAKRLAAVVTCAVLSVRSRTRKAGYEWVAWSDTQSTPFYPFKLD